MEDSSQTGTHILPTIAAGPDVPMWKTGGEDDFKLKFSATSTWSQLRHVKPTQVRHSIVWFSQGLPRYSFITWLAIRDRLATGARMRSWGFSQPCLLCGEPNETRDHIFFACPFSFMLWMEVAKPLLERRISWDWSRTLLSLSPATYNLTDYTLLRLCFQAVIYHLWRERNRRKVINDTTPSISWL